MHGIPCILLYFPYFFVFSYILLAKNIWKQRQATEELVHPLDEICPTPAQIRFRQGGVFSQLDGPDESIPIRKATNNKKTGNPNRILKNIKA